MMLEKQMLFSKKNKINQEELKKRVAKAAIDYIQQDMIIGVGTGSTINYFIEELKNIRHKIDLIVSSSEETSNRLKALNFKVVDLNYTGIVDIYVDGADEANEHKELIKGGGAALTREKICRVSSRKFVCIIDESKYVKQLGNFPLPVEVIPMARSYVTKELIKLSGRPLYRENVITNNSNIILDVYDLDIRNAIELENRINQIVGVVCNGLFAVNAADELLIARDSGKIEIVN